MNIEQVIRSNAFFSAESGRVIEDIKIEELMINVKYKEQNEEMSSSICALRAPFRSEKAKKPAYVLAIALGCVVKKAIDSNQLNIKVAPMNDEENINLDFDGQLSEEEFFQLSLIHDFRSINFDHIHFIDEMVELVSQYEAEL
ncbi:hypothetical protein [Escherichia phage vB_EcoM_JNE01]|nr:hypothetical protein [Escherichia phage vB_EcoM_JNE01]